MFSCNIFFLTIAIAWNWEKSKIWKGKKGKGVKRGTFPFSPPKNRRGGGRIEISATLVTFLHCISLYLIYLNVLASGSGIRYFIQFYLSSIYTLYHMSKKQLPIINCNLLYKMETTSWTDSRVLSISFFHILQLEAIPNFKLGW